MNIDLTNNRKAYGLLILTTWCWGCNAIFGKVAVGEVSPMLLVTLRWLGVVILLLAFANKYVRRDWVEVRKHGRCIDTSFGRNRFLRSLACLSSTDLREVASHELLKSIHTTVFKIMS